MPAFAQNNTRQETAGIQDIIVTAQRREQALQDVPLAISAFNADTLERVGVNSVAELVYLSPGLVYQGGDNSASPYLRGVGTTSTQSSGEPPLAMYVDGFYYPAFESALLNFSNISSIAVLRGPQGTLFGRNVTAGLIQVTTKDPTAKPSGNFELRYGNFNHVTASGYFASGITDNLAADISVYYLKHDGWGRNLVNGEDASRSDQIALRSKWVFNPGPDTQISLMLDYSVGKGDIGSSTNALPGFLDATGSARPGDQFDAIRNLSTADNKVVSKGAGLKIEHDLGFAKIRSLTSHRVMDNRFAIDGDASPLNLINANVPNHSEYTMQELQLVSGAGSSFEWILGAFYQDSTGGSGREPFTISGDVFPPFLGGGFANNAQTDSESWAVYAQSTVKLAPGLRGTIGLRYTDDSQRITGNEFALAGFPLGPDVDQSDSWNQVTWRLALDYDFSDDVLGYISYNRGYKAGRFDFIGLRDPAVNPAYSSGGA
ncbi:TonB-dependent receptor domain-containing protein [Sphingobium sp. MK2]|uniref:TonB-dependent receptor n=1 Tax=Sphingobium sp. MK2 TaxID=3116540 RepID=UPI0032E35803